MVTALKAPPVAGARWVHRRPGDGDRNWLARDALDVLRLAFVAGTAEFALMGRSTAVGWTDRFAAPAIPTATVLRGREPRPLPGERVIEDGIVVLQPGDQLIAEGEPQAARPGRLSERMASRTYGAAREPVPNILPSYDGSPEAERAPRPDGGTGSNAEYECRRDRRGRANLQDAPVRDRARPDEVGAHQHFLAEACSAFADRGITPFTMERVGAAHEAGADLIAVRCDRGLLPLLLPGLVSGELAVESPCDVLVAC